MGVLKSCDIDSTKWKMTDWKEIRKEVKTELWMMTRYLGGLPASLYPFWALVSSKLIIYKRHAVRVAPLPVSSAELYHDSTIERYRMSPAFNTKLWAVCLRRLIAFMELICGTAAVDGGTWTVVGHIQCCRKQAFHVRTVNLRRPLNFQHPCTWGSFQFRTSIDGIGYFYSSAPLTSPNLHAYVWEKKKPLAG